MDQYTRRDAIESQLEPGTVILERFDDAYIGASDDGRAVYDIHRMTRILMKKDGMTEDKATDHIENEIVRALAEVDRAPIILYPLEE